jgi:hypothetical protein
MEPKSSILFEFLPDVTVIKGMKVVESNLLGALKIKINLEELALLERESECYLPRCSNADVKKAFTQYEKEGMKVFPITFFNETPQTLTVSVSLGKMMEKSETFQVLPSKIKKVKPKPVTVEEEPPLYQYGRDLWEDPFKKERYHEFSRKNTSTAESFEYES